MRASFSKTVEDGRVSGWSLYRSEPGERFGAFLVQGPCGAKLRILMSGGGGLPGELGAWEHVSVSLEKRIPNWLEMSFAKSLFWGEEECVLQFHPPASRHVNQHPNCLHLWRPVDDHVRQPPMICVGMSGPGHMLDEDMGDGGPLNV